MNSIILRPEIPYYGNVPSNFATGKEINVDGIIPSTGLRFSIGLQCNYENQTDIPLEVIVDLFDNVLSINSKQNNVWFELQTTSISHLRIQCERKFKFTIQYNLDYYRILINDREIVDYPQRISCNLVTHFVICGEIQVFQITYTSDLAPSAPVTPPPSYNEVINSGNHSVYFPEAPGSQYNYGSVLSRARELQNPSPIALNQASPNFRPVKPSNRRKFVTYVILIFFIILILLASYAGRKEKPAPRYTVDRESAWK